MRDFIAGFDLDFLDRTHEIARHFDGSFIRFEREDALFFFDGVAGFDIHFDDIDVFEIADIGYFKFGETHVVP